MKRSIYPMLSMVLAGCGAKDNVSNGYNAVDNIVDARPAVVQAALAPTPMSVVDLIKNGAPQACVADEVKDMIVKEIMPDANSMRGPSAKKYPKATFLFETATPVAILQASGSIMCHASLGLSLNGFGIGPSNRLDIDYTIGTDLVHPGAFSLRANLGNSASVAFMMLQAYGITGSGNEPIGPVYTPIEPTLEPSVPGEATPENAFETD